MTLEEVRERLSEIKKRGYVRTLRRGPTGIGYTLETLLEIEENNISTPDLGEIELKTRRKTSRALITLFTFNEGFWKMDELEAIKKYGKTYKNGRMSLYSTVKVKPNKRSLFLSFGGTFISLRSTDGSIIAEWKVDEIEEKFNSKVKNLLLVKAKVKKEENVECFLYNEARLFSVDMTKSILRDQFECGKLCIDLRLHDGGTSARNHGTGLRTTEKNLENLYQNIQEIEF